MSGAAHVSESSSLGLMPQHAPTALLVANTLTQPTELSQNPLCTEIQRAGHQDVCKVLFDLRLKFIIDLKADLLSHVPIPAYSCAACSVLPFKPCWRGRWRAQAVCLYKNQTWLSYQNKARLAVSLSAKGEKKKKNNRKSTQLSLHFLCTVETQDGQLKEEGD